MKKDIVFFGIQGAGKTVQSKEILKKFSGEYEHISPGQMGREMSSMDNVVGRYINETQLSGKLYHSNFTGAMVEMFFWAMVDSGKSVIYDAYARNKQQVDHVIQLTKENKRDAVGIFLEVPEKVGIERLMWRGRSDDTTEAIQQRIKIYYEETLPWVDYFGEHFPLHKVDGNRSVDEVFADVERIVGG